MTAKVCLDLFSGLGGFSAGFADSDDWRVVTVDVEERFEPDVCADVMELLPSDLPDADVVLASPPCDVFTMAASIEEHIVGGVPRTEAAKDAVALVYHTLGIIQGLSPAYWYLENPMGYLRQVIGRPTARVTYCQYGTEWMKPTDLWGEHAPMTYRSCSYGDDCHAYNTDQEHGGLGNCAASGTRDSAERAKVPYDLSEAIREAVDAALAGDVAEQSTLAEAVSA